MSAPLPIAVAVRGAGPPLLLLHGFAASRFTYRYWVDDLATTHQVHLFDLFGCGSAPFPPDDRYGPREQGEAVLRYVRENDLRGVTIVGHSLGGGIALFVALRLQEMGEADRLAGLVSVAGAAYAQAFPKFIGLARVPWIGRWLLRAIGPDRVVRGVLKSILYDPSAITDQQVEGYAAPLRQWRRRRAVVQTARQIVPAGMDDLERRWRTIQAPTLLLWGRQDVVVPLWVGERLARELPHAELVVLERCGHVPPEEHAEESLAHVRRFLRQIDPASRASR